MFRIDRNLDYGQAIDVDRHESWGSSLLWPAIVRLHSEMPAQDVPLHWHLGAEVIYVVKGRVRMFVDGVETIVNDGQICLVSPKALHAIHPIPYGSEQCVLSISFDGEYLSRMSVGLANHRLLTTMPIGRGCQHSAGRLIDLCNQIIDCINAESDTRFLRLNALLYTLLCELFDVWDDTLFDTGTAGALMTHDGTSLADNDSIMQRGGGSDAPPSMEGIRQTLPVGSDIYRITEYMGRHFADGETIGNISRHFGFSREYFSRMFKRHTGVSPDRYLTEIRLQSAVDDLLNGDETVEQIARSNGFSSARSFSRAFQTRFASTPATFRRRYRDGGGIGCYPRSPARG